MSMEKFKRFLDDHKKELIATTVVAGGVVLVMKSFAEAWRAKINGWRKRMTVKTIA